MAELAAVGAAIGCPISESGEDRMEVTARLGAFIADVETARSQPDVDRAALAGTPTGLAYDELDVTNDEERQAEMIAGASGSTSAGRRSWPGS